MAQNANEQFSQTAGPGSGLRIFPALTRACSLAAGATALAVGTPMAYNTSTNLWVVFASGGANGTGTIGGFVYPNPAPRHATDETTAVLMLKGKIHISDIPILAGYTLAQLKTEMQSVAFRKGLEVEGLESVR